jgi:LPXTG-motif cell wall-anchored protein
MRVMVGFRFVALAYALLVFLIAPSWLAADESSDPLVPAAVEESATTVEEAVPEVPEVPVQTPVTGADEPDQAEAGATDERKQKKADRKAKAAPAKADEKKQQEQKEPSANASASATVTISDFKFTPDTVTVNEGDSVTWTNDGPSVHTATADDGSFDTGSLRKGESGSATFTSAGTITYICQPHPFMKGKVIVQAASAGSGGGSGSSGGSGTGSTDDSGSGGAVAGDDSSSGSGLPNTGGDALSIALLGLATLGLGLLMRRRRDAA